MCAKTSEKKAALHSKHEIKQLPVTKKNISESSSSAEINV